MKIILSSSFGIREEDLASRVESHSYKKGKSISTLIFGQHDFIEYKRKFYDSEAPKGVSNWWDLPIFKRVLPNISITKTDIKKAIERFNKPYFQKNLHAT